MVGGFPVQFHFVSEVSKIVIEWIFSTLHVMHVDIFNNYHVPRARMDSESIVHEAEGRMDYLLRGHEGERNKIVLVKSN